MNDKRRNDLAAKLFDKYSDEGHDILPCLENFIENFQSGLTDSLNKLPLDASVISNNQAAFDDVKDQVSSRAELRVIMDSAAMVLIRLSSHHSPAVPDDVH